MDRHYRHTVLGLCVLTYFGTRVSQLVISPLVPEITTAFSISQGVIGAALTGMWAAYALTQLPSGLLGDRFGERLVILIALGSASLASLLLVVAPSFAMFAAVVVLLGAGVGLQYNVGIALLTKQFEQIGRAIGLYRTGGQLAGLVVPVAAAAVSLRFGWRVALLLGAGVCVPTFILFAWRIRPTPPTRTQPFRDRLALGELAAILSRPPIAASTALAVLAEFVNMATMSFLPAFLVAFHGFTLGQAGIFFSAFFVITTVFLPASGWIADRFSRDSSIVVLLLVGAIGYGTLVVGSSQVTIAIGIVLAGVGMSWDPPVQSQFVDHLAETELGMGFGLIRTVYVLLGALGSVVTGTVADVAGWGVAFTLLAGVLVVALSTVIVVRSYTH